MGEKNSLIKLIQNSFKDPITSLLLKNSNLTNIQFETLIIDFYTVNMDDNRLTYDVKSLFRSKKVTRGSFSRTLSQARKNIISSIYTILLLEYIGIFDTAPFDEYKNLADKLREYLDLIQSSDATTSRQLLQRIERELMNGIRSLAEPRSLQTA